MLIPLSSTRFHSEIENIVVSCDGEVICCYLKSGEIFYYCVKTQTSTLLEREEAQQQNKQNDHHHHYFFGIKCKALEEKFHDTKTNNDTEKVSVNFKAYEAIAFSPFLSSATSVDNNANDNNNRSYYFAAVDKETNRINMFQVNSHPFSVGKKIFTFLQNNTIPVLSPEQEQSYSSTSSATSYNNNKNSVSIAHIEFSSCSDKNILIVMHQQNASEVIIFDTQTKQRKLTISSDSENNERRLSTFNSSRPTDSSTGGGSSYVTFAKFIPASQDKVIVLFEQDANRHPALSFTLASFVSVETGATLKKLNLDHSVGCMTKKSGLFVGNCSFMCCSYPTDNVIAIFNHYGSSSHVIENHERYFDFVITRDEKFLIVCAQDDVDDDDDDSHPSFCLHCHKIDMRETIEEFNTDEQVAFFWERRIDRTVTSTGKMKMKSLKLSTRLVQEEEGIKFDGVVGSSSQNIMYPKILINPVVSNEVILSVKNNLKIFRCDHLSDLFQSRKILFLCREHGDKNSKFFEMLAIYNIMKLSALYVPAFLPEKRSDNDNTNSNVPIPQMYVDPEKTSENWKRFRSYRSNFL